MATPSAVGGCEAHDATDPGNLQLDWLEVQLQAFRSRGMQVRRNVSTERRSGTLLNLDGLPRYGSVVTYRRRRETFTTNA